MKNFNSFAELAAANGTPVYQPFTTNTVNAMADVVTFNEGSALAVFNAWDKIKEIPYKWLNGTRNFTIHKTDDGTYQLTYVVPMTGSYQGNFGMEQAYRKSANLDALVRFGEKQAQQWEASGGLPGDRYILDKTRFSEYDQDLDTYAKMAGIVVFESGASMPKDKFDEKYPNGASNVVAGV